MATVSSFAEAKADADAAQAEEDLRQFHERLYAFGDRPSDEAVARTIARAKANPDDVRWLFWAGQWGVDGRVKDFDWMGGLRRAAAKQYPPAMVLYGGVLCGSSKLPATDVPGGVELIRQAAVKDDALALHQLAIVYTEGLPGIQVNLDRAEALAQRAMDRGMLRSLRVLAKIYARRGDQAKATEYIWRAVEIGDPDVIASTVDVYLYGKTPNPAKAVELLRRGALLGEPAFMEEYAMALELDLGGLKQDRVLSRQLLQRAISMGNRAAEADWAYGQVTGAFGVEEDKAAGLTTLQRMSDAGQTGAQLLLARMLMKGEYVKRDEKTAIALVRMAAEQGDKRAQRELERQGLGLKGQ
ncbi:MAG TPA: tetratricopeptide repeat protein [Tepidisphaeraceae bacterium]